MRSRARRLPTLVLTVLTLSALLAPNLALAAPARTAPARAERAGGGLLALVRSFLDVLWGGSRGVVDPRRTGDNGSGADPDGSRLTGDNGPGADPNGSRLTGDNGSGFDPDGRS